eukprot:4071260-Pleurochrysis_carterae.AAC.2
MGGTVSSAVNCDRRESSSVATGARDSATRASAGRATSVVSYLASVGSTRSLCARAECADALLRVLNSSGCATLCPVSAACSLAFAEDCAAIDSARARIKASIASCGNLNCNWMSFERETTRCCVPSGLHAMNGSRYG